MTRIELQRKKALLAAGKLALAAESILNCKPIAMGAAASRLGNALDVYDAEILELDRLIREAEDDE